MYINYLMDLNYLRLDLITNKQKSHTQSKHVIKDIYTILDKHKTIIDITHDSIDTVLNSFLIDYIKLVKLLQIKKEDIENHEIIESLIDDIISKVEENNDLIPILTKKKIELNEKCIKHYKSDKNKINIVMK